MNMMSQWTRQASSGRFILGGIVLLFLLQAVLYRESFSIRPAADDFNYVNEANRGNALGPAELVRHSFTVQTYRPIASLGIWAALKIAPKHRPAALRTLGFLSMALYAAAAGLWLYSLRVPRLTVLVAAAVLLFHPVLPAALGSIDGFNAIFSSAALWLGGWCVWRCRHRPTLAALLTFVCLVVGAGAKEHAFALLFLAPAIAWFSAARSQRLRLTLTVGLAALFGFSFMLIVRALTIPPGDAQGLAYASLNPLQWARNIATIATGLLFFGNSVWVFEQYHRLAFATLAVAVMAATAFLFVGLLRSARGAPPLAPAISSDASDVSLSPRRLVLFLLLALAASTFPVILMTHVSEMYLAPMLLPLAILCGLAMLGWIGNDRQFLMTATSIGALGAFMLAMFSSVVTGVHKMHDLRLLGDRADVQLGQALALVPADARDFRLLLLFADDTLPPRRTYSVFRMGDELLLVQLCSPNWLRPGRNITTETAISNSLGLHGILRGQDVSLSDFDLVLEWNPITRQFHRRSPPTSLPS